MEIGGLRAMWLFPDMLKPGTEYFGQVTGSNTFKSKNGTEVPYVVWVGEIEGYTQEYQVCAWKIASKTKLQVEKLDKVYISRKGDKMFFFRPE